MTKFKYDGVMYDANIKFHMVEIVHIEESFDLDFTEMRSGTSLAMGVYMALRRGNPQRWNPTTFKEVALDDLEMLEPDPEPEPEEEKPDPTEGLASAADPLPETVTQTEDSSI